MEPTPPPVMYPSQLSFSDWKLFWSVYLGLLAFVNDRQGLYPDFGHPLYPYDTDDEERRRLRDKLWEDDSRIDAYIASRTLPKLYVKILKSWKKRVTGTFILIKQADDYAILMDGERGCLWGVKGISHPLSQPYTSLPQTIKTSLLPFKDCIVYDGFLEDYRMTYGPGIRQDFINEYTDYLKHGVRLSIEDATRLEFDDENAVIEWTPKAGEKSSMPPELKAEIDKIFRDNPRATEDELNAKMAKVTGSYNAKGQKRFDGLSPNQMMNVEYRHFGKNGISIKDAGAGENTRFVRQAAYFLSLLAEKDITLTSAGYLPPKIVENIYQQHIIQTLIVDWNIERFASKGKKFGFRESDVWPVQKMHAVCETSGLVRKVKGKITLTQKGIAALKAHALFEPLFITFCEKYNWAYMTGYSEEEIAIIQNYYAFSFYLLFKYGHEKKGSRFYSDKFKAANFLKGLEDPCDLFESAYRRLTFEDFLELFDMVDIKGSVSATPLFYQVLNVDIPNEVIR
jgi:hypothetical protein